jgi:hypothetical protein
MFLLNTDGNSLKDAISSIFFEGNRIWGRRMITTNRPNAVPASFCSLPWVRRRFHSEYPFILFLDCLNELLCQQLEIFSPFLHFCSSLVNGLDENTIRVWIITAVRKLLGKKFINLRDEDKMLYLNLLPLL